MTPNYKNVHLKFKLNNYHYSFEDLMEVAYSFTKEGEPYQQELGKFLLDWLDKKDYVIAKTSGSTGKPKELKIKKQSMVNSAIMTGDFFKVKPGDKMLYCLPSNFIAGKMMIVRAIVLGLELDMVEPTSNPIINYRKAYDFCAMTPMQLTNFLKFSENIKTIIVGGSRVPNSLVNAVQNIESNVYETYGMTETVTHIAIKKINNHSKLEEKGCFKTLPDVTISQDDRDCLVIEAPKLSNDKIVTNDIVKIHSENSFEWLGRFDNVVNSGGIKLFPEQIESKLQSKISNQFFITSENDDILGDKLILIAEGEQDSIDKSVFEGLDKYEIPKTIYYVPKFSETLSGKIHRKQTLEALNLV